MSLTLKDYTDSLGFVPRRVMEIATGRPENTYLHEYIASGIPTTLVEPQLALVRLIQSTYGHLPNVVILQRLITPNGEHRVMVQPSIDGDREGATFVEGVFAPACQHVTPVCLFPQPYLTDGAVCCEMSAIDPGDVDVLNLDIEGSEWLVLSTMVSRPKVIHVEVYGAYGYTNHDLPKMEEWMERNGYRMAANPGLKDPGQNRLYIRP